LDNLNGSESCSKRRQGVKLQLKTIIFCLLFVFTGAFPTQAQEAPITISKDTYISLVEAYIRSSKSDGLSKNFLSLADIDLFKNTVLTYINGVAVDEKYLQTYSWTGLFGGVSDKDIPSGLTQQKDQGWTDMVTPQEGKYDGFIILRYDMRQEFRQSTAFHEGIHAFHFAIGSSVDADANGAPEYTSNKLHNGIFQFKLIDEKLRAVEKDVKAFADKELIAEQWKKIFKMIEIARPDIDDASPHVRQVVKNMGGKLDIAGYVRAVEELKNKLDKHKHDINGRWFIGGHGIFELTDKDGVVTFVNIGGRGILQAGGGPFIYDGKTLKGSFWAVYKSDILGQRRQHDINLVLKNKNHFTGKYQGYGFHPSGNHEFYPQMLWTWVRESHYIQWKKKQGQ